MRLHKVALILDLQAEKILVHHDVAAQNCDVAYGLIEHRADCSRQPSVAGREQDLHRSRLRRSFRD